MTTRIHDDAAPEPDWNELRPVLDDAMHEIGGRDREAILLRYFENRPYAEIAAALALTENSARMRVERALQKLRARLAKRGITSSATALALVLSTQTVSAAPAGLAAAAANASIIGVGAGSTMWGVVHFMSMTKAKIVAGCVLAVALSAGGYLAGRRAEQAKSRVTDSGAAALEKLRAENERLLQALSQQTAAANPAGVDAHAAAPEPQASRDEVMHRLRTVEELKQKHLATVVCDFVTDSGKISDKFADLFGLSAAERDALQQTTDQVREKLDAAAMTVARVSRDQSGNLVIHIPPMAGETQLYDQLFDGIAHTLGAERYAVFFDILAQTTERAFNHFGAEERTLVVSRSAASSDGRPNFTLKDMHKSSDGSSTSTHPGIDAAKLGEFMGALVKLVPAES